MYGPVLYFGTLTDGEVRCNPAEPQPITHDRKDIVITRINVDHKGMSLSWEIEDEEQAEKAATTVIEMLSEATGTATPPRQRRHFTREEFEAIAQAYNTAPEGQRNRAIRDLMGVSRQNATNYINRCRALGLIAPSARSRRKKDETPTYSVFPSTGPTVSYGISHGMSQLDQILASQPGDD